MTHVRLTILPDIPASWPVSVGTRQQSRQMVDRPHKSGLVPQPERRTCPASANRDAPSMCDGHPRRVI